MKGIDLSAQVSQDKLLKRFHYDWRAKDFLTVDFLGIILSTRCVLLLWILMKTETPPPQKKSNNHNSSYYPSLLHITHDISSDGPVVGQRDRNVGGPHGQHNSAWEEKAVSARLAFPPTVWQQVRARSFLISEFRLFYLSFLMMCYPIFLPLVAQKVARSSAEADWRHFKLWPPLSAQVSSESEPGKHQSFKIPLLDPLQRAATVFL